jgi:hypothetical protein
MNNYLWKTVHRYCGLGLASFIIFYAVTGILLNHRERFHYFTAREVSSTKMEQLDTTALQQLLAACKKRINRKDDPRVIRIPDSETIEFLYGSHGKIIYRLNLVSGVLEKEEKQFIEPFSWLNKLHKANRVSVFWLLCADLVCLLAIVLTVSGLVIMRYKRLDYLLLSGGILLFFIGMAMA